MPHVRPIPSAAWVLSLATPLVCTGCAMRGELFETRGLRIVVLAVVLVAAVGLIVSRSRRR